MTPKTKETVLMLILCALYRLAGASIHARFPLEAIMRKLPPHHKGLVRKALEELRRRGFVYIAGGKGSETVSCL